MYRVPDKNSKSVLERRGHDADFVKDLVDGVFNIDIQDADIGKMYRLGQWTENKGRNMLIGFMRYQHKEQIMSNLCKFKDLNTYTQPNEWKSRIW